MSEFNKTFDDLVAGDEPVTQTPVKKRKTRTKKSNNIPVHTDESENTFNEEQNFHTNDVKEVEKLELVRSEGSEYVTTKVEAPVNDPAYAIEYYQSSSKNLGAASIWFGFAYLLIGFPVMWLISMLNNLLTSVKVSPSSNFVMGFFVLLSIIGFISFACAIIGFFQAKKHNHKWWLGLIGLSITVATAVSIWILFV